MRQELMMRSTYHLYWLLAIAPALAGQLASSGQPESPQPPASVDGPRDWPPDAYLPVTADRVSHLPVAEQAAWRSYLDASQERARLLPALSARENAPAGPVSTPPRGGLHTRGLRLDAEAAWYASEEARTIADRVVERQSPAGAWTKGIDYTRPREKAGTVEEVDVWSRGTLDNSATTAEMRFLTRVIAADQSERARPWRAAFLRGLEYIFAAQYPNGGFPQIYPLAGGYHDAITYNDSAMTHALEILRDVSGGKNGYEFVSDASRADAERRLRRGIECILATQITTPDGRRTVWCQQHDALTLRPCAARNFEPVAASAQESALLVEFLRTVADRSPAVAGAIDEALAWFSRVALRGVAWDRMAVEGSGLTTAPGAPLLWARMYEIGSDKPLFGDRDRTIHYTVTEISSERRLGYGWYGTWPQALLDARQR
jgi:PelA/Pel-15E family pectate lyase